jgi:hypothetical protein
MNNKPVAWRTHYPSGWEYKDGNPPFELKGNSQLLYTRPAKTLTDEEMRKVINENVENVTVAEMVMFLTVCKAILRKAQEK